MPSSNRLCHKASPCSASQSCPLDRTESVGSQDIPIRPRYIRRRRIFQPESQGAVANGFRVSVSKEYLSFSSAHFITLTGHQCESLHGHNYRVGVMVEGALDPECSFVVDFGVLKRILRPYIQTLDHRVLLPSENSKLVLRQNGDRMEVGYLGGERFVFPLSNCALLPISNTTAEMIAEYLARRIRGDLRAEGLTLLDTIEVEVEESPGQSGYFRLDMKE
jgi:6-pyruvoyltetrahydropterin/6-carboxytetrahydropterin synthase